MAVNDVQLYVPGAVPNDPVQADDDFERRRREARARLAEAMKGRPIQHWTQGLHQMAESALAGYDEYRARQDAREQRAAMADIMSRMYGGGAGGQGSGSVGGSPGPNIPAAAQKAQASPPPVADSGPIPNDIAQSYGIPGATFAVPGPGIPDPGLAAVSPPAPDMQAQAADDAALAELRKPFLVNPHSNFDAGGQYAAAPKPPPQPQQMAQPQASPQAMSPPTMPGVHSSFDANGRWMGGQQQIAQRPVQTQPITPPMAPAPGMDPGAVSAMSAPAPKPDLAARVPHPGMMQGQPEQIAAPLPVIPPPQMPPQPSLPRPQGLMGLGAELPPVDGVVTSKPPSVSTAAPPANADLAPLDIKDLTGGITRGPGGERDPSGIQRIIAHDVAGNITPENLARYSQQNKGYHYAVDRNTGQVYQLQKPEALAYHAKGGNSDSLGVAMTGFEGQPVNDKALASMNALLSKLGKDHNITPDRMLTHPGVQPGKHAKEADWLKSALDYKPASQVAAAPASPPAPAVDPAKAQGLIQMAQNGPAMTPELFKELALRNPALAQQLLLQDMQQRRAEPDRALNREHQQLQNQMLRKQIDEGKAPQVKEVNGKLVQVRPDGRVSEIYDGSKVALDDTARNIAGGLENLSRIPEMHPNFEGAVGMWEGDPSSKLGAIGRFFGGSGGAEVRSQIEASAATLAASIKPLIRKPGEGAWSDVDQQKLDSIVGNLTQANDAKEYRRRLEGVRQRVMDNFGIQLPEIGHRSGQQRQQMQPPGKVDPWAGGFPGTGLPEGFKIRRLN